MEKKLQHLHKSFLTKGREFRFHLFYKLYALEGGKKAINTIFTQENMFHY